MDIYAIARLFGVSPIIQGERATFYLVNRNTRVQLKLEMNATTGWLRLHADIKKKSPGRHISTVEIDCVEKVLVDTDMGDVRFIAERVTLTIQTGGTFRVDVL